MGTPASEGRRLKPRDYVVAWAIIVFFVVACAFMLRGILDRWGL